MDNETITLNLKGYQAIYRMATNYALMELIADEALNLLVMLDDEPENRAQIMERARELTQRMTEVQTETIGDYDV